MICSPAKDLAGTVLQNEQLATNVQAIANNLAVASSNLNRLGLWHFLWHHEPLRTNAERADAHATPRTNSHDSTLGHSPFVSEPVHDGRLRHQPGPAGIRRPRTTARCSACSSASASADC